MAYANGGSITTYLEFPGAVISTPPFGGAIRFKANGVVPFMNLLSLGNVGGTGNYVSLALGGGGSHLLSLFVNDSSGEVGALSGQYSAGQWYVGAFALLTTTDRRCWLNGANEAQNVSPRSPTLNRTNIGVLLDGTHFGFLDGVVAEAAFWDLSSYAGTAAGQAAAMQQIALSMAAGASAKFFTTGRVALWECFMNDLATEPDIQGNFPMTGNGSPGKDDHPATIYYPDVVSSAFPASAPAPPPLASPTATGTYLAYTPRSFPAVAGSDEWYCIGFGDHPAVRAGETLSDPTCATDMTQSSGPVVLVSPFIGRNTAGQLVSIAAGQGVKVRLTGSAGLHDVAILVRASGGETIGAKFQVGVG